MSIFGVFKVKRLLKKLRDNKSFRENFLKKYKVSDEDKAKFTEMLGKKKGED